MNILIQNFIQYAKKLSHSSIIKECKMVGVYIPSGVKKDQILERLKSADLELVKIRLAEIKSFSIVNREKQKGNQFVIITPHVSKELEFLRTKLKQIEKSAGLAMAKTYYQQNFENVSLINLEQQLKNKKVPLAKIEANPENLQIFKKQYPYSQSPICWLFGIRDEIYFDPQKIIYEFQKSRAQILEQSLPFLSQKELRNRVEKLTKMQKLNVWHEETAVNNIVLGYSVLKQRLFQEQFCDDLQRILLSLEDQSRKNSHQISHWIQQTLKKLPLRKDYYSQVLKLQKIENLNLLLQNILNHLSHAGLTPIQKYQYSLTFIDLIMMNPETLSIKEVNSDLFRKIIDQLCKFLDDIVSLTCSQHHNKIFVENLLIFKKIKLKLIPIFVPEQLNKQQEIILHWTMMEDLLIDYKQLQKLLLQELPQSIFMKVQQLIPTFENYSYSLKLQQQLIIMKGIIQIFKEQHRQFSSQYFIRLTQIIRNLLLQNQPEIFQFQNGTKINENPLKFTSPISPLLSLEFCESLIYIYFINQTTTTDSTIIFSFMWLKLKQNYQKQQIDVTKSSNFIFFLNVITRYQKENVIRQEDRQLLYVTIDYCLDVFQNRTFKDIFEFISQKVIGMLSQDKRKLVLQKIRLLQNIR